MKHQDIKTLRVSQLKLDLIAAKALIDTPDKWCQGQMGHTERCSVAALIAINAVNYEHGRNYYFRDGYNALLKAIPGGSVERYNDTHTHAEVMAMWDRAIASV